MSSKKPKHTELPAKASVQKFTAPAAASMKAANTTTQTTTITGVKNVMNEGKAKLEKLSKHAAEHGKEHLDALSRSGTIFAKGFEEFFKTYTALAQSAAERNAQTVKALLSSKTLNEFTELQTSAVQQNFDDFLTGVTKLSELGVKLATETMEPINDHVSKTIKKAGESIAA